MTIEALQKRIDGKEKEVKKLESKLGRIKKAQDSGWKINPYYYDESDLRRTNRDLEEAKEALENYKAQMVTEIEKANSRNIPAIIEFLEAWKKRVTEFYLGRFTTYPEAKKQYEKDLKEYHLDYWEERKLKREDYKAWRKREECMNGIKNAFNTAYGCIVPYVSREYNSETRMYDLYSFNHDLLAKDLKREAERKYDFIVERTNAIVGTITDASNLKVGEKGDLNGYIYGDKGTVSVQTIGAGGYNIQCYHFRTLINKVNKKG